MTFNDNNRPAPHAGRDTTEQRTSEGRYKSPFKSLEGQRWPHKYGEWIVGTLYKIEERNSGYSDWSQMWWSVQCSTCGTSTVMDRRDIKKGIQCRVCRATAQAKAEVKRERERVKRIVAKPDPVAIISTVTKLAELGLSQRQIATTVGRSQGTVSNILRNAGVSTQHQFKYKGQVITDPEVKKANEKAARDRSNAKTKTKRDAEKLRKIADGTYRGKGCPRKYQTRDERLAANRAAYAEKVGRPVREYVRGSVSEIGPK